MNHAPALPADHREISELIPWHVNGTIGRVDRQKLDAHFLTCAACLNEMLHDRRIYRAMSARSSIECTPAASLRRLRSVLTRVIARCSFAP